ncbi:MAG: hypothetical protein WC556_09070 [Candidatus Methanoperedens sp.]
MNTEYLFANIKDFKEHPKFWLEDIPIYFRSIFISRKNKIETLNQARIISETFLKKKGLSNPFKLYLDNGGDIYWRTKAWYQPGSSKKGIVEIHIRFKFMTENVLCIVHNILHEYSHAIYEEGSEFQLGFEINKLIHFILPQRTNENIFDDTYYEFQKEYFCDWFAQYLMNGIIESQNKVITEKTCKNILQKYNYLHLNSNTVA